MEKERETEREKRENAAIISANERLEGRMPGEQGTSTWWDRGRTARKRHKFSGGRGIPLADVS